MNNTSLVGVGVRKDINFFTREINPAGIPFSNTDHHAIYGKLLMDTFNRRSYNTRGHQLLLQATFSSELFLSPLNFSAQRLYWEGWYPVADNLSFQNTLFLGRSTGEELPWRYWFSPNRRQEDVGIIRFGGFGRHELTGRNFQMVSAGIQYEFRRHRFFRLDAYAGNAFEEWSFTLSDNRYLTGYSFSLGALTILGPVEAIFSTSTRNRFHVELQVGYEF